MSTIPEKICHYAPNDLVRKHIAFCWGLPFEHIFYVDLWSEILGIKNSCKCTLHTWRPVPAFDPVHQQCPHLLPPLRPEPSPPPAGPWQQPPSGGSHPTLLCCSAHSCLGVSKACAPSRCALVLWMIRNTWKQKPCITSTKYQSNILPLITNGME